MTAYDAIKQALDQGCTTKNRALAQARAILRGPGKWWGSGSLEDAWSIMLQDGRIEKRGRTWHVVEREVAP